MSMDEALDEQRELVRLLEEAGWDVTDAELSVYESPWEGEQSPEATVTLTARKLFPDEEGEEGDGDENPYQLK